MCTRGFDSLFNNIDLEFPSFDRCDDFFDGCRRDCDCDCCCRRVIRRRRRRVIRRRIARRRVRRVIRRRVF